MRTYFRDFGPTHIEDAWRFSAQRNALGHNVRLVTSTNPKHPAYRVYFSATKCKPKSAVSVYDVPAAS